MTVKYFLNFTELVKLNVNNSPKWSPRQPADRRATQKGRSRQQ